MALLIAPIVSKSGVNDLIYNNGFEQVFFVGGITTTANVIVRLNQFDDYIIPSVGSYVIPNPIENGTPFQVEIISTPTSILCSAENNLGVVSSSDIIDVDISCGNLVTIYQVKQELVTGLVALENLLVTACKDNRGYWVQTIPGDIDYIGADYSASYVNKNDMVCTGDSAVTRVGDRISLNPAFANNFFGQVQMVHESLIVHSNGNALPDPVIVPVVDLSGGVTVPIEGVLIKVENVVVTAVQTPAGAGESEPSNAFEVNDALIVDDIIYLANPFPIVNDTYDQITGILTFTNNLIKLLPRYSQDVFQPETLSFSLVINEIGYDHAGLGKVEYIEIFNPTNTPISLINISLYLINGNINPEYHRYDFDALGVLESGQYLVLGSPNMITNVASGALTQVLDGINSKQNDLIGDIVLINRSNKNVIDSHSL